MTSDKEIYMNTPQTTDSNTVTTLGRFDHISLMKLQSHSEREWLTRPPHQKSYDVDVGLSPPIDLNTADTTARVRFFFLNSSSITSK